MSPILERKTQSEVDNLMICKFVRVGEVIVFESSRYDHWEIGDKFNIGEKINRNNDRLEKLIADDAGTLYRHASGKLRFFDSSFTCMLLGDKLMARQETGRIAGLILGEEVIAEYMERGISHL